LFPQIIQAPTQQPKAENISIRKVDPNKYGDVLGETVGVAIPKDHFIHAIRLRIVKGTFVGGTSPAWVASAEELLVTNLVLRAEGSKRFKEGKWKEFKALNIVNLETMTDGSLKLYFTDPKIPDAKPLPAWRFTSLTLELTWAKLTDVTTGTPTGTVGTKCEITLEESHWDGEQIDNWPCLIEVVRGKTVWGANTGWQNYDHERVNLVNGFLYHADDNNTDSTDIFDTVRVIGRTPAGSFPLYDEVAVVDIREANKNAFMVAMGTGYWYLDFAGLNTRQFTSLKTQLEIQTAGTNAGIRVMERYTLA